MPNLSLRQVFQPSCPNGGDWYACDSGTHFVGCCASDPCTITCSDGDLRPASFDPSFYGKFPDQQCNTGSRWYTCKYTDPPFMGCCKSPACDDGCPDGDLTAGFLDSNPDDAAPFLSSGSSSTATSPSSSIASSLATSSPTSTSISTPSQTTSPFTSSLTSSISSAVSTTAVPVLAAPTAHHTGTIVGATVGGAVVIIVVLLLFWYHKRHVALSRRQSQQRMTSFEIDKTTRGTAAEKRSLHGTSLPGMSCSKLLSMCFANSLSN